MKTQIEALKQQSKSFGIRCEADVYTNMRKFMMNDDALAFSVLDPKIYGTVLKDRQEKYDE
jgi:hypothetical protein